MRVNQCIRCVDFPCRDVDHNCYVVPDIALKADDISMVMISEAAPANSAGYYYAKGDPLFAQTTVQAFNDAGAAVKSVKDILDIGVYLTTAVKCSKTAYGIQTDTIVACSRLLEQELALFKRVKVLMLMGDVAIKAVNAIARRTGEARVIPAGATYKMRSGTYILWGARVFPSYLQAGPSFFIEKVKRRMIAEDIATALALTA